MAEEIVQEAFLRMLAARQDGLEVKDVRAWIFRVARNQWIDRRREGRRYWIGLQPELGAANRKHHDPRPDPEQQIIRRQQLRRIAHEVSLMPRLQRECMRLKAQGLRYHEIADALDISMTAAVDHVRRAVAKLRKVLRTRLPRL
jgi:RNA polymerase sigma-70 factor (ECF subfamily)